MYDKLGILIVEEADGKMGVQLFADPVATKESFDNLIGKLGQKPQRVRFIVVTDKSGQAEVFVKDLPVTQAEPPEHYVIGEKG